MSAKHVDPFVKQIIPAGLTPKNITTSTTTLVATGPGVIHGVNINTLGTVASVVTIYDSLTATGTKIATIDSLNDSGWNQYDAAFTIGLCVVTTGAPDITVIYNQ